MRRYLYALLISAISINVQAQTIEQLEQELIFQGETPERLLSLAYLYMRKGDWLTAEAYLNYLQQQYGQQTPPKIQRLIANSLAEIKNRYKENHFQFELGFDSNRNRGLTDSQVYLPGYDIHLEVSDDYRKKAGPFTAMSWQYKPKMENRWQFVSSANMRQYLSNDQENSLSLQMGAYQPIKHGTQQAHLLYFKDTTGSKVKGGFYQLDYKMIRLAWLETQKNRYVNAMLKPISGFYIGSFYDQAKKSRAGDDWAGVQLGLNWKKNRLRLGYELEVARQNKVFSEEIYGDKKDRYLWHKLKLSYQLQPQWQADFQYQKKNHSIDLNDWDKAVLSFKYSF